MTINLDTLNDEVRQLKDMVFQSWQAAQNSVQYAIIADNDRTRKLEDIREKLNKVLDEVVDLEDSAPRPANNPLFAAFCKVTGAHYKIGSRVSRIGSEGLWEDARLDAISPNGKEVYLSIQAGGYTVNDWFRPEAWGLRLVEI